jgi:hypothetical protein
MSMWAPTSGSRNAPATRRLQLIRLCGQRRRMYGSAATYMTQNTAAKNNAALRAQVDASYSLRMGTAYARDGSRD